MIKFIPLTRPEFSALRTGDLIVYINKDKSDIANCGQVLSINEYSTEIELNWLMPFGQKYNIAFEIFDKNDDGSYIIIKNGPDRLAFALSSFITVDGQNYNTIDFTSLVN